MRRRHCWRLPASCFDSPAPAWIRYGQRLEYVVVDSKTVQQECAGISRFEWYYGHRQQRALSDLTADQSSWLTGP